MLLWFKPFLLCHCGGKVIYCHEFFFTCDVRENRLIFSSVFLHRKLEKIIFPTLDIMWQTYNITSYRPYICFIYALYMLFICFTCALHVLHILNIYIHIKIPTPISKPSFNKITKSERNFYMLQLLEIGPKIPW